MRADGIVARPEFPKEMIEVPFAEDDEVIEALIADCLNKAFGKGVEVRRFGWKFLHFSALAFDHRVKFVGELGVAVPDQAGDRLTSVGKHGHEISTLLLGPRADGIACSRTDVDPPASHVNEEQHVVGHLTECGLHLLLAGP